MNSILSSIQSNLENLYEVSIPNNVLDFLITDKKFAEALSNTAIENNVLEQLLICGDDEHLGVSLYLNNDLVNRLEQQHLTKLKDTKELYDFWIALEGVSHFLYLAWNAKFDRPVSQLELELQAEVDKFVSATNTNQSKVDFENTQEIWSLLFSKPEYRDNLNQEELIRYQTANTYAAQYCLNLIDMQSDSANCVEKELRRFYRLRQKDKIYRIDKLNS